MQIVTGDWQYLRFISTKCANCYIRGFTISYIHFFKMLSPQGMHFLNFPPAMQTVYNLMQVLNISQPNTNLWNQNIKWKVIFATQNKQHLVRTCSIVTFHFDIAYSLLPCLFRASRRRKWGSATKSTQRSVNPSCYFVCIRIAEFPL